MTTTVHIGLSINTTHSMCHCRLNKHAKKQQQKMKRLTNLLCSYFVCKPLVKKENLDHHHHGQSQTPIHLTATAAHLQHSSSQMQHVSQQPIFISAPENRPMDLMQRRRVATTHRRNFAIGNDGVHTQDMRRNWRYSIQNVWAPTAHHSYSHHHHHHPGPMHQNRMHQPHNVPMQAGQIINSGILLNFL